MVYIHVHAWDLSFPICEGWDWPGLPSSAQLCTVRSGGQTPGLAQPPTVSANGTGRSEGVIGGCLPGERQGVIELKHTLPTPRRTLAEPGAPMQGSSQLGSCQDLRDRGW